ncbi:MAG: hypothetical protein Q4F00_05510 [bacterium]|nr:hypothetical protein [bacterium]
MRRITKCRVFFLFLALSLLFGWGIAGCTDKDREKGPVPEPSADTVKYRFLQDSAAKVSAEMTEVSVSAFDADWNMLDGALLLQGDIGDMARDGEYIVAEAVVPEGTALLAYCFTNDPDDEAVEEELEIYVIALEEDKYVYTMADEDYLEEPVLQFYADAGHQTEKSEFTVGEEIYPAASAATRGGLQVPVTVCEPVDEEVVAYTPASADSAARYTAKAEGASFFVLYAADSFWFFSENGVSVKAAEPGPEPTPEPTPSPDPSPAPEPSPSPAPEPSPSPSPDRVPAWILPEGYEVKDGAIYKGEEQITDPAAIETVLEMLPEETNKCRAVEAVNGGDGQVVYKALTAEITPSIESAHAAHFSASAQAGNIDVTVSEDAETEETAAFTFAAEGFEFQNGLNVTVLSTMRHVTVKLQMSATPHSSGGLSVSAFGLPGRRGNAAAPLLLSDPAPSATRQIKAAALNARDEFLPGAQIFEEDFSKYVPDSGGFITIEADIPTRTKSLLFIMNVWVQYQGSYVVTPYLGLPIDAADTYSILIGDLPKYYFTSSLVPNRFGPYADEDLTDPKAEFAVGDYIYFCLDKVNAKGVKASSSPPVSLNTAVVDAADGRYKAVGAGNAAMKYNWYGFEGLYEGTAASIRVVRPD